MPVWAKPDFHARRLQPAVRFTSLKGKSRPRILPKIGPFGPAFGAASFQEHFEGIPHLTAISLLYGNNGLIATINMAVREALRGLEETEADGWNTHVPSRRLRYREVYQVHFFCVLDFKIRYSIIIMPIMGRGGAFMDLSELTTYAREKYKMQEQHKWSDFPGFSVLCHPQTGKWVALLMRQWDTETGTEIQRCDLKCGGSLGGSRQSYLSPPIRMHGSKWVGVCFDERTEPQIVFHLLDQAIASETPHGFTIVLDSQLSTKGTGFQETALPFSGSSYQTVKEQLPKKLRELRRLFEYDRESAESRANNFYRQAVFMQDYEDDCPWSGGSFVRYFPTYHDLTTRQLRGYFTWRTAVRRGEFQPIAASAAYIYLYELLNGVGADSPEDALEKLTAFKVGYLDSGIGDQRMRSNLRRWMLEYAVMNDLPPKVVREYADPELMAWDESLAILRKPETCSEDELFSALCVLGGKKIAESPVIKLDPARGRHLFSEAWRSAAAYRRQEKMLFALCFGEKKTRRWYPLSNAVYYAQKRSEDREYVLNECRSFWCKDGLWTVRSFETLSYDKARLQGFLHETDARLRRYLKTGRYLREKPEDAWAIPFIDAVIDEDKKAVMEASRPKITIDLSDLERIRRDALVTRDSLLTEEELDEREALVVTPAEKNAPELPLDTVQIQIVRALLHGEDVTGLLKGNHLMPSMAADFINEALFDEIGDTVVACEDDRLTLIEDYFKELAELLGGTSNG
ncbi:MAG: hypothetical protein E7022_01345 [Desulfovibrio desulfuricans]|nr:hypothetical protein [Desulfovibrio desulfuricans]